MRNFTIGWVCGLVVLVGFAGSAAASATIDLIWRNTGVGTITNGGHTISGMLPSESIVLDVVLTAGPLNSNGAGVSVDYSALAGITGFSLDAFASVQTAPLPLGLGSTTDNGSVISNIVAVCFGIDCLANGVSHLIGSITFTSTTWSDIGNFEIIPFIDTAGTDGVLDGFGSDISTTSIFNSAFAVVPVPEPGTFSLLGMGLGGLYAVGRRSSRKA